MLIILLCGIFYKIFSLNCNLPDDQKGECGYMGIKKDECEGKGCCWQQRESLDTPWCYFPLSGGNCFHQDLIPKKPFLDGEIDIMLEFFKKNIDLSGSGAVCASPSKSDPDYYYHWMRDGALTMNALMIVTNFTQYEQAMKDYVKWVLIVQYVDCPYGDVRINPKFEIYDHSVFHGGTDGPALRALTLVNFGNVLLDNGEKDYVSQNLWTGDDRNKNGGVIKYDLEWVLNGWAEDGCDLWEEVRSTDFFWNRIMFKKALVEGAKFAERMGDKSTAQTYRNTADQIHKTVKNHWNGNFVWESTNRLADSATILGFNEGYCKEDGDYSPTSQEVAATIEYLDNIFCVEYYINRQDSDQSVPGVLYGRYPGDIYYNGNAWILLTASLAQIYYRGAKMAMEKDFDLGDMKYWSHKIDTSSRISFANGMLAMGDNVMLRIRYHTEGTGFHLAEQLDKHTGYELGAPDLTWSYAEVLKACRYRVEVLKLVPPIK